MYIARLFCVLAVTAQFAAAAYCELQPSDRTWLQTAIDTWDSASVRLGRRIDALPWVVVYDEQCMWSLNPTRTDKVGNRMTQSVFTYNGTAIPVYARAYKSSVPLPNGNIPIHTARAFTSVEKHKLPFFAMALPSMWRKYESFRAEENIDEFALGVFAHEVTHTLQIVAIFDAFTRLSQQFKTMPPKIDDDYIQAVFGKDAAYVAQYEHEFQAFAAAVNEPDIETAKSLARDALRVAKQRRERFFTGDYEYMQRTEPIFLNMEGIASWIAYTTQSNHIADIKLFSGKYWSQQEGLVLMLLLDRFLPGWKPKMLDPATNPFTLLEDALR
jgi:hypothetical protein